MELRRSYSEIKEAYLTVQDKLGPFLQGGSFDQNLLLEQHAELSGMDFEAFIIEFANAQALDLSQVDFGDRYFGEGEGAWLLLLSIPLDLLDLFLFIIGKVYGIRTGKELFRNSVRLRNKIYGQRRDISVRELVTWKLAGKFYDRDDCTLKLLRGSRR